MGLKEGVGRKLGAGGDAGTGELEMSAQGLSLGMWGLGVVGTQSSY